MQRVAVDFVQDPGVKEAAQSFARDERVKVAALKATGLEGGAAICSVPMSLDERGCLTTGSG